MAARILDFTAHGMPLLFVGAPTVLIGGMPAARVTDGTFCPIPIAPPAPAPHATELITVGSPTVLTAGMPQAYVTSLMLGAGPPNLVVTGSPSVMVAGAPVTPGVSPVDDARETLQYSPGLMRDINALQGQGWTVRYGTAGDGTFTDPATRSIVVDPNESGNPNALTQSLAHEAGHANHTVPYHPPEIRPGETPAQARRRFIDSNTREELRGEGAATLRNAEARDEILRNGGPDIGIAGARSADYQRIAADPTLTRDQRMDRIADVFGRGEQPSTGARNYNRHYGGHFEREWERNRRAGTIARPPAPPRAPSPADGGPGEGDPSASEPATEPAEDAGVPS